MTKTGVALSRGRFIARMDADDICTPERIESQLALLQRHPDLAACGAAVVTFAGWDGGCAADGDNVHLGSTIVHPTHPLLVAWDALFYCCIAHPTALVQRRVLDRIGGYTAECRHAEDYDLWLRVMFPAAEASLSSGAAGEAAGGSRASDMGDAVFPMRLGNIGSVALGLRKHGGNVSSERASEQVMASIRAVQLAVARLTGEEVRTLCVALFCCRLLCAVLRCVLAVSCACSSRLTSSRCTVSA